MDHRDLLKKYMRMIVEEEGITFLMCAFITADGCNDKYGGVTFTEAEKGELLDIASESGHDL